ncbi:hypothetical protein QBC36DRAFT_38416 [Triangularia setosa]|uniref:Uncharacterized protein n=1 Tax=Triangularia setosa TaxID=2587417 RepID=A0AAN7A5Z5_9PEZI|nr:hypothetical protein QBC36DRAFT_38416 [Podospora setosa]
MYDCVELLCFTFQVATPTIFDKIYGYNLFFIGLAFLPGLRESSSVELLLGRLSITTMPEWPLSAVWIQTPRGKPRGTISRTSPIERARYRCYFPGWSWRWPRCGLSTLSALVL